MAEVRAVSAAPRAFAGVSRKVRPADVARELMAGLDVVWPVVRARGPGPYGHNIAAYHRLRDGSIELECGVEVDAAFEPQGEVSIRQTPVGTAASATHVGPVERIGETYRLIDEWLAERGISGLGVSWEIYGHVRDGRGTFDTNVFVLMVADEETRAAP